MDISKKRTIFAQNSCHYRQVYIPNRDKNKQIQINMETKIASYQEAGIRLQLIYIMPDDINLTYTEMKNNGHYQIRKNRKVLCNFKWQRAAKQKFNALIKQELLQTKMDL